MSFIKSLIGGFVIAYIMPVAHFLGLAMVLILADLVTGVWAAKKRMEPITSRGFRRLVEKTIMYFIAILLSEGMMLVFKIPYLNLTYVVAFAICLTEFQSNIENVGTVTGVDIWERIKGKFKKVF